MILSSSRCWSYSLPSVPSAYFWSFYTCFSPILFEQGGSTGVFNKLFSRWFDEEWRNVEIGVFLRKTVSPIWNSTWVAIHGVFIRVRFSPWKFNGVFKLRFSPLQWELEFYSETFSRVSTGVLEWDFLQIYYVSLGVFVNFLQEWLIKFKLIFW